MGGQKLKIDNFVITRRYNSDEYEKIKKDVLYILRMLGYTVFVPPTFSDKKTHGDLDVLVKNDGFDRKNLKKTILKIFKPKVFYENSFDWKEFQIDLIHIKEENWLPAKIFYSWGDLSNILGHIINNYGNLRKNDIYFKWGFDGLKIKFKKDSFTKTIYLSKNPKDLFSFLGLDPSKLNFKTKYEMFDFTLKSKYFDKRFFKMENLRNYERKRNQKRPDYLEYVEYIKNDDNFEDFNLNWDYYLSIISDHFKVDLISEYNNFLEKIKMNRYIKEKFNGHHIIKLFKDLNLELDLRNIGTIKNDMKEIIENSGWTWEDYIASHSLDTILSLIDCEKYVK